MRRLNLRLISILTGSTLLFVVAVLLLQRWQVSRNIAGLLRRADLAEEAGETGETISLLSRYSQQRPDDVAAFTRMALLVEERTHDRQIQRDEFNQTWQLLEKAVRQQPENEEVRRATIDFYLRFARYKDASEHLETLLRDDPNSAELQFQLARAQTGGGDYEQASAMLESIVGYVQASDDFDAERASDVANVQAYEMLAAIAREHQRRSEFADRVMQQCVSANPQAAAALLARGRYQLQHHRNDATALVQAKADIRRAAELSPDDAAAISTIADLEISEANIEQAASCLESGIEKFPERDTFYRQRAKLAIRQNDADAAMTFVEAGLAAVPDSWSLLLMQAELDLAAGRLPRVEKAVGQLRGDERMRLLGDYLHARVQLARGQWAACSESLEELLPKLMTQRLDLGPQAYLALARCYEQLGQPDRQRDANRQLLELEPLSIAGHFSESRARMRLGHAEEARQSLATAQRIANQRGLELPELNNWETTLLAAEQRTQPLADRDVAEVERRFLAALESRIELTTAQKAAAHVRFLMQQQQVARATQALDKALEDSPTDTVLLLTKVDLTQLTEGTPAAAKVLNELKTSLGDSVEVRLREALLLAGEKAVARETRLRALEDDSDKFSAKDRLRLWQGLGAIHRNLGNSDEALRLWKNIADANPADLTTRMNMFELARTTGDVARMRLLSEDIHSIAGGDSAYAKFTEAICLLAEAGDEPSAGQLAAVRRLANAAQSQRPRWHALSLLQAELDLRDGNVDSAIDNLQKSLDEGPASPPAVRKLVELLWSQQRIDEARAAMELLGDDGNLNTEDVRLQSRAELAGGELQTAIELARRAANNSDDVNDHLWLGRLLARDAKSQAAVAAFRRAVEIAPENEQARLSLVRQLLLADLRDEAEAEVGKIQRELPPERADSVLGIAYELLGETELARKHFEQAVAARPNDPAVRRDLAAFHLLANDNEQAIANLDLLISLSPSGDDSASPHFAWAGRTKAELIGATGRYDDFQQAVRLLQANKTTHGMPAIDLLMLAKLTLPRNDPYALRSAISEFNQAKQQRTFSDAELLMLARLYEAAGDWQECEAIMSPLVARAEGNPTIVVAWCEMKLARDDIRGIEPLLRQLDQVSPVTQRLRARLFAKQGRDDRAIEMVRTMVPPADDKNRLATVFALARFLESLELPDEAKRYYRAVAKQQPNLRLNLADFLARNGKLDEALEICDEVLSRENVVSVTRIAIMGLTAERGELSPDAIQYVRVASWLARGLSELPDSKGMLLNDIYFYELREQYAEAIKRYRKYLWRGDLQFHERAIAANNLAMVFAGQGSCDEAQKLIDEAIELVGPTVAMLDTRAMVALCHGDADSVAGAVEELELAAASSREPVIDFHLAVALEQGKQAKRAEQVLRDALAAGLDPQALSAWDRTRYAALAKNFGIDRDTRRPVQLR